MTESDDRKLNWEDLSPEEKKFLTDNNVQASLFMNCPPERLESVERILKLFNDGKLDHAILQLAEIFSFGDEITWTDS